MSTSPIAEFLTSLPSVCMTPFWIPMCLPHSLKTWLWISPSSKAKLLLKWEQLIRLFLWWAYCSRADQSLLLIYTNNLAQSLLRGCPAPVVAKESLIWFPELMLLDLEDLQTERTLSQSTGLAQWYFWHNIEIPVRFPHLWSRWRNPKNTGYPIPSWIRTYNRSHLWKAFAPIMMICRIGFISYLILYKLRKLWFNKYLSSH